MRILKKALKKRQSTQEKQKQGTYGITLIALVITVVVMLILAGVAISVLTDDGGLFAKVEESVNEYQLKGEEENKLYNNLLNTVDDYFYSTLNKDSSYNNYYDTLHKVNKPNTKNLPMENIKYLVWDEYSLKEDATVPENWYDYENGKWANIKTNANGLEAYWVWIPRFAYKLPEGETAKEIEVMFIKGNGTTGVNGEKCYYATDKEITTDGSGLYSKKTTDAHTKWIIHPAFTFGDKQISGIWIAKFHASNLNCTTVASTGKYDDTNRQVRVVPGVTSWRNIQISKAFTVCENMTKNGGTIGTATGNNEQIDTHMMKNIEWGAVAILSKSKYGIYNLSSSTGINGDKTYRVWNNPNENFITGQAGNSVTPSGTTNTNAYNTSNGVKASTTGTIYGVYDMSLKYYENVMGFMAPKDSPNEPSVGYSTTNNTGFIGKLDDGTIYNSGNRTLPNNKYFDIYTYSTSGSEKSYGKIGDATTEFLNSEKSTWNDEYTHFISVGGSNFDRGKTGILGFDDGSNSSISEYHSFRPILIVY